MMMTNIPPTSVSGGGRARTMVPPRKPVSPPNILGALRATFFLEFWPFLPLALALLALAGVLAGLLAWNGGQKQYWIDVREINVLFINGVEVMLAVCSAVAGAAIGVCQARAQISPALWGFVKQRPAAAGVMFAGRVLAGGALYGIAVGVPLVLLALYAATHGTPFEWHFLLPMTADGLAGFVYYLAGLLVVQRHASFFGSRLLPLAGALICSAGVYAVPRFSQAILIIGIATLSYGLAAMGALSSNGYRVGAARPLRTAMALVLLAVLSACLTLASWQGEGLIADRAGQEWYSISTRQQWYSPEMQALRQTPRGWVNYVLLPDATLGRQTYTEPSPTIDETIPHDSTAFYTYERVGPPDTPYLGKFEQRYNLDGTPSTQVRVVHLPETKTAMPLSRSLDYRNLQASQVLEESNAGQSWSYVEPVGLLQLYDAAGHFRGSLGENGFAPPGAHAVPFGVSWSEFVPPYNATPQQIKGKWMVHTPRGIFDIDLEKPSSAPRWLFPTGRKILGVIDFDPPILVSPDRLYIYGAAEHAHPARELPLAFPSDGQDIWVEYLPDVQRWAIWYEAHRRIDVFDADWQEVSQIQIPGDAYLIPRVPDPPEWLLRGEAEVTRGVAWRTGVLHALCDLPLLRLVDPRVGHRTYVRYLESFGPASAPWYNHWFRIDPAFARSPWYGGAAAATLLVCGAVMGLLTRRYGVRYKILWILATLVFGPVSLLLLMCLYELPWQTQCKACGKKRFVHTARCPHCGMAAIPAANSTEIFTTQAGGSA